MLLKKNIIYFLIFTILFVLLNISLKYYYLYKKIKNDYYKQEYSIKTLIDDNNKNKIIYLKKFNELFDINNNLKKILNKKDIKSIKEINNIYYNNNIKDTIIINNKYDSILNNYIIDTTLNCIHLNAEYNNDIFKINNLSVSDTIYLIEKYERKKIKILFLNLKIGKKIIKYEIHTKCGISNTINYKLLN